jgi:signal transduction histidine kinase
MDQNINILVVDDQEAKLLTYETMLADLGGNLIRAHSGREALEQILRNEIALVLMDVNMNGMDGFETANLIHSHPRFETLPIVFVSATLLSDFDKLKGYQHGAVDYVTVPIVPELLRAKVRVFVELHRKKHQLEQLNSTVINLQEQERKRIAQELHDSIGQLLAVICMNCSMVKTEIEKSSPSAAAGVHEIEKLAADALSQIRTISHLLHPPLLDEAGLSAALTSYIQGFSERSRIATKLICPAKFSDLSAETELSIFRIVQESLTNVLRHSGSRCAEVRISQDRQGIVIEVEDQGRGVAEDRDLDPLSFRGGVGIRGMRERLRQLGGTLQLQRMRPGTLVRAEIPSQN